jgi:hypothetical protein
MEAGPGSKIRGLLTRTGRTGFGGDFRSRVSGAGHARQLEGGGSERGRGSNKRVEQNCIRGMSAPDERWTSGFEPPRFANAPYEPPSVPLR